MTLYQADSLKHKYEPLLIGKPIGKDAPGDLLVDEIIIKEITPNNYEVVLVADIGEGADATYRTLRDYLEENPQNDDL